MMTFAFVAYTVVQSRQISGWAMVLALLEAYWWEYYCWRIFSLQWLVG